MKYTRATTLQRLLTALLAATRRDDLGRQFRERRTPSPKRFAYERWISTLKPMPSSTGGDQLRQAEKWDKGTPETNGRNDDFDYCQSILVLYTNDPGAARRWIEEHLLAASSASVSEEATQILGWDMESAPDLPWRRDKANKRLYYGPATVQLSVVDAAMVLQIAQDGCGPLVDTLPVLRDVLADTSLLKVGVSIDQDLIELYRWCDKHASCDDINIGDSGTYRALAEIFNPEQAMTARFDLGGMGANHQGRTTGLGRLAATVLKVDLPKSKRLARSPWATAPLNNDQIEYAARDAWAAVAVLHSLARVDADQFSNAMLVESVYKQNMTSIAELSDRAHARREAKLEWKALKGAMQDEILTSDQKDRLEHLEQEMRRLAPPLPLFFPIDK